MMRTVNEKVQGVRTQDGAGVSLVRVLGTWTVDAFDPFLMLDSFDSTNPADYAAGFPMHPHRGIETVSYVARGKMLHRDSMGHEDEVSDGEIQWMCAGSGILHEERIPEAERLLGCQLWLNLPAADKMCAPSYHAVRASDIEEIALEGGVLRLLAGEYEGHVGHKGAHLPLDYYDIRLDEGAALDIPVAADRAVLVFTLIGEADVCGEHLPEKTAARPVDGDMVRIEAAQGSAQILFMSSKRLDEPVAWGGPIVMNTQAELSRAFDELQSGTFLREGIDYE